MPSSHVAVWLDHDEAKVFKIEPEGFEMNKLPAPHCHLKRKHGDHGGHREFFREVARALDEEDDVLVVGPSSTKLAFIRYLQKHHHALEKKVLGVESLDHPTDGQLAVYVRAYFKIRDSLDAVTL